MRPTFSAFLSSVPLVAFLRLSNCRTEPSIFTLPVPVVTQATRKATEFFLSLTFYNQLDNPFSCFCFLNLLYFVPSSWVLSPLFQIPITTSHNFSALTSFIFILSSICQQNDLSETIWWPCLSTGYHVALSASFTTALLMVYTDIPLWPHVWPHTPCFFSLAQDVTFTRISCVHLVCLQEFGSNISFSEFFLDSSQLKSFLSS